MKTSYLQALLKINAARITELHMTIDIAIHYAKAHKADGEKAFSIDQYNVAGRTRKTLAKAVEMQRELKAQLAYNTRIDFIRKMYAYAFGEQEASQMTSVELEALIIC